jgi:CubicO group peptidase (beta-lactamase class C family)
LNAVTDSLTELLDGACGSAFPGAVACAVKDGQPQFHYAAGDRSVTPDSVANTIDTLYDLASLTKPMVVGTLLMHAVSEQKIGLDEPITDAFERLDERWSQVTVRHLAGHTSGLPGWRDLGAWLRSTHPDKQPGAPSTIELLKERVFAEPFVRRPGEAAEYSDFGYLILGWMLERRMGAPLAVLFERVREAFGLVETRFLPSQSAKVAPTEDCPVRGRIICGEVHDLNAWYLGGVAGHAGLFGTAMEVAGWGQTILDCWLGTPGPVPADVVRRFWDPQAAQCRTATTWRLCFDGVSAIGSTTGRQFGPLAVGHLGFTGASIWIEPQRRWVVVLLCNRVHPNVVDPPPLRQFRPVFHDGVAAVLL